MCVPGRYRPCLWWFRSTAKLHEVGADAAVVEQGVALAGRTVGDHALAASRTLDQEAHHVVPHGGHLRGKPLVTVEGVQARPPFDLEDSGHGAALGGRHLGRCRPGAQGATVTGQLLHVDDPQARCRQHALRRQQAQVRVVLVVDRVELQPRSRGGRGVVSRWTPLPTVRRGEPARPRNRSGPVHAPARCWPRPGRRARAGRRWSSASLRPEKADHRRHAVGDGPRRDIGGRLHAEAADASAHHMAQQSPVVRRHLDDEAPLA